MAKLIHKNKIILLEMKYATNILDLGRGLMFASKKKIDKGICMVLPRRSEGRVSFAITMLFCFYPYDILFINSRFEVVDKVMLNPWRITYIPKKPCKYVIESSKNKFKNIKVGDVVNIEKD